MSAPVRSALARGAGRTLAVLAAGTLLLAQERSSAQREFAQHSRTLLLESGQRHLELGLEMRDRGLVAQAASEILAAVEASEGQHPGASAVLSLMRSYDERFWKKRVVPTPARLDAYEKKAAKVRRQNREARYELAGWAWRKQLEAEASREYEKLLALHDRALELDARGRVVLDVGALPAELSARLVADAITINGRPYVRDAFLARLPLAEIFEHESERLVVRSQRSVEEARALHRLGEALLPLLEEHVGGRPARRLFVFVFAERAVYEAWLESAGMQAWSAVSGLADLGSATTLICAEGRETIEIQSLLLHELTHLAEHAASPARMPEWFREGLAESIGGIGCFAWDGEKLAVGGLMARERLAPLLDPTLRWSIAELARLEPLALWRSDREAALRYYAQSFALYRFLSREAPKELRQRFDEWVAMCRGSAVGADEPSPRGAIEVRSAAPAQALFERLFDASELEAAFLRWLETL